MCTWPHSERSLWCGHKGEHISNRLATVVTLTAWQGYPKMLSPFLSSSP